MNKSDTNLLKFADQEAGLATLIAKAQHNLQLNQTLKTILPANAAKHCKVIRVDDNGVLIVVADSGTVAARLKLLANGWPRQLAQLGFPIQSVHVSVSPLMHQLP